MSAFICGPDHFKAIAVFATTFRERHTPPTPRVDPRYVKGLDPAGFGDSVTELDQLTLANLYAEVLYRENVRSVQGRYPDSPRDDLPGPNADAGHVTLTRRDLSAPKYRLQPVAILKLLDCLEYQSCEPEDWETTVAFRLTEAIRGAAIGALPGYSDAPWHYVLDVRQRYNRRTK